MSTYFCGCSPNLISADLIVGNSGSSMPLGMYSQSTAYFCFIRRRMAWETVLQRATESGFCNCMNLWETNREMDEQPL